MIGTPLLDLGDRLTGEAARQAALAYPPGFITRYFQDAKGEPIELEEFHLEIIDALTDPSKKRVLLLAPADHGKTTLTRWCLDYLGVLDRNIRMMLVMNNATDAEQALGAIERDLSDPNSLLVGDFGSLRGDVWQTTQFNIKGRTIVDKEPTLAAYGTGSNVFGHRSDVVVCDDLLNLDNAGPYVTERTRAGVHEWFFQGLLKVAGAEGKVVVIGTVMDRRDLYHELMDPKHGFTVIRMQALLDDETHAVLWPKRNPYSYLAAARDSDYVSFMKRYQNTALDPSTATFDSDRLPGCLDRTRRWGEITPSMSAEGFTRVVVSLDPASSKKRSGSKCGFVVGCYSPKQDPPRTFYVLEIYAFQAKVEEMPENVERGILGQVETVMQAHEHYHAALSVIEANAQNEFVHQIVKLRQFTLSGNIVEPHYTSSDNKWDPEVGVRAMAAMFNAGLIRFPYGDDRSRREVDDFFAQELVPHPMGRFTDRLMALWFFVLKANQFTEPRYKTVFRKFTPLWARGTGLSREPMRKAG